LACFVCWKWIWAKFLKAIVVSIQIREATLLQLAEGREARVIARIAEVKGDARFRGWWYFDAEITSLRLSKRTSSDGMLANQKA
jgi:hypothetical protein